MIDEEKRAHYLRMNKIADTWYQPDPDLLEDVDGAPLAVVPSDAYTGYHGGLIVTVAQLARAGLTPADVPNLSVLDTTPKEKK